LNIEFGWKPFVKDVLKAYNFQRSFEKRYNFLVKNNGLPIRRRDKKRVVIGDPVVLCEGSLSQPFGRLDNVSIGGNSQLTDMVLGGPLGSVFDYDGSAFTGQTDYRYQTVLTTTEWSVGTFKYYVPDIGSDRWTAKAKAMLSGTDLSPATLYDVMPWTWLLDWFSNVGDVVHNLTDSRLDNETLTDAFAMYTRKSVHEIVISTHWDGLDLGSENSPDRLLVPAGSDDFTYSRLELMKTRHQASPFGFGVPREAFSASQWAILAALGVTREKRDRNWLKRDARRRAAHLDKMRST
jgi:hypothetical protein